MTCCTPGACTQWNEPLTVLEAGRPRSRCQQGEFGSKEARPGFLAPPMCRRAQGSEPSPCEKARRRDHPGGEGSWTLSTVAPTPRLGGFGASAGSALWLAKVIWGDGRTAVGGPLSPFFLLLPTVCLPLTSTSPNPPPPSLPLTSGVSLPLPHPPQHWLQTTPPPTHTPIFPQTSGNTESLQLALWEAQLFSHEAKERKESRENNIGEM